MLRPKTLRSAVYSGKVWAALCGLDGITAMFLRERETPLEAVQKLRHGQTLSCGSDQNRGPPQWVGGCPGGAQDGLEVWWGSGSHTGMSGLQNLSDLRFVPLALRLFSFTQRFPPSWNNDASGQLVPHHALGPAGPESTD